MSFKIKIYRQNVIINILININKKSIYAKKIRVKLYLNRLKSTSYHIFQTKYKLLTYSFFFFFEDFYKINNKISLNVFKKSRNSAFNS